MELIFLHACYIRLIILHEAKNIAYINKDIIVTKVIQIIGLRLPEITCGVNLADVIINEANKQAGGLKDKDIIVVTSKIISKAKGYLLRTNIKPSLKAKFLARIFGKPSWEVELILKMSRRIITALPVYQLFKEFNKLNLITTKINVATKILETDKHLFLVETLNGRLCTDAGLDASNIPKGFMAYPPPEPNREAEELRKEIEKRTGKRVAIIITDTEGDFFKIGSHDIAIGSSGIYPISKKFAEHDIYGKPKYGGIDIIVDQLAEAAALLMGQTSESIPVVIIRGVDYEYDTKHSVKDLEIPRHIWRKMFVKVLVLSFVLIITIPLINVVEKLLRRIT